MTHIPQLPTEALERLFAWSLSDDTGSSSRTLAAAAGGLTECHSFTCPSVPHDDDDFGRCLRLVEDVPEIKVLFPFIREALPIWAPILDHWDYLATLSISDSSICFDAIRKLNNSLLVGKTIKL